MARLVKKEHKNFTILSNNIIKNKNLSWKARGLFTFLWSRPNDWNFNETEVKRNSNHDGMTSLRNGLHELEKYNYLLIKYPGNSDVRVGHSKWLLSDQPMHSSSGYRKTMSKRLLSNYAEQHLLNTDNTKHSDIQNTDRQREITHLNSDSVYLHKKFIKIFNCDNAMVGMGINRWLASDNSRDQILKAMKITHIRYRVTNPNAILSYINQVIKYPMKPKRHQHRTAHKNDTDDSKYNRNAEKEMLGDDSNDSKYNHKARF